MIKDPIYNGLLQSDLDFAGFSPVNLTGWPPSGGGGGTNPLLTVNVKDAPYSAAGDGVTDDTTAIQAAINHVGSVGGGTVFFPKGIYLCNGAFDATTNSILKFPFVPLQTAGVYNNPVTIELIGETPAAAVAAVPLIGTNGSIIKSTKTGTGSNPSLLAAATYVGRTMAGGYLTIFSYVQVVLRNISFQVPANPTIDGVRLDSAVMAILEDVVISTPGDATEPTHSTVGLWMPATLNFGTNYPNRIFVQGFDTGMVASAEHFRGPQVSFLDCHIAAEFLSGGELGWGNLLVIHCKTAVKFTSIDATAHQCPVVLNLQIEHLNSGWQTPTVNGDILDSGNNGAGEIRHYVWAAGGVDTFGVTGGSNLRFTNLADASKLYVGTDARLTAVSGGVKLETRNTGTGVWVESARWTNP